MATEPLPPHNIGLCSLKQSDMALHSSLPLHFPSIIGGSGELTIYPALQQQSGLSYPSSPLVLVATLLSRKASLHPGWQARRRCELVLHICQGRVSSVEEGAELPLYLSVIRLSQRLTFAGKMLVGTRGKLNMDPPYISTGELSAKKKKKE